MAESRDYDELLFAWKGWRDAAGKIIRQDYMRYVELANKAAKFNGKDPAGENCSQKQSCPEGTEHLTDHFKMLATKIHIWHCSISNN